MDPSKTNLREHLWQAIDAEIKSESSEESIRALRHRRNALAPISSLPPEVIAAIFSFVRSPLGGKPGHHLAWLSVAHVCHQWREIALNLSLFWSHVDFTTVSPAGATEILARARMAPLYLEANIPIFRWDNARISAFQQELQTHISHICYLCISADTFLLRRTLEALASPAPILEYLSLIRTIIPMKRVRVSKTLFGGTTPRLSYLRLCNCDISWKSPLLVKGLKSLEILTPFNNARPKLAAWLDALDEMSQLKMLVLHSASPVAPPFPFDVDVKRTVTLPSLTHLNISTSAGDCALALAHLVLPALTSLYLTARSHIPNGGDVHKLLPYVARHAHGPQDTRPLQCVLIRSEWTRADVLAWPAPDPDAEVHQPLTSRAATLSPRVALSIRTEEFAQVYSHHLLDAVMAALPLDSLVTLAARHRTRLDEQFWLHHAPRWPLLQRVRLAPPAARGFRHVLLLYDDDGGRSRPLLPSLKRLDLIDDTALSARRTLWLCEVLMKRVGQGVPLETLDLRTCLATGRAVQLLSEIVVDVWGPAETLETKGPAFYTWDSVARGNFVHDEDSGEEDYSDDDSEDEDEDEDDSHTSDEDEEEDEEEIDNEGVGGGEEEVDSSEIEED